MTRRCLPLLLILSAGSLAGQESVPFTSVECRLAFEHPAGWTVQADSREPCAFRIRPADWADRLVEDDSVDVSTAYVYAIPEGIGDAAEQWGFERRGAAWVVLGRHGIESPAETITIGGWRGFRGDAQVGCYRIEGGYAGLCTMAKALVGTDERAVLIEAFPRAEGAFEAILLSLKAPE